MTDNTQPTPQKYDDAVLEELATGFRLMDADSPLKRLATYLARREEGPPNPREMAEALMQFSDKHVKGLTLPDKPGDISTQTLQAFVEKLDNTEVKALQYAAGREDTVSRRSILGGLGLFAGAALTASGATAWAFQSKAAPSTQAQTSSDADKKNASDTAVPESTILLTFGGALITIAALMKNLRQRRENTNAFDAERHLPETAAKILIDTDRQLKAALAAKSARETGGQSM